MDGGAKNDNLFIINIKPVKIINAVGVGHEPEPVDVVQHVFNRGFGRNRHSRTVEP